MHDVWYVDTATWTRLGASNVLYSDCMPDLSAVLLQGGCWGTRMVYPPSPFVRLPTAASPCWDLVADHSPRDIKVLSCISTDLIHSPLIPVNPMAPARKAEVATD